MSVRKKIAPREGEGETCISSAALREEYLKLVDASSPADREAHARAWLIWLTILLERAAPD
jgi:hypothetical protein